MRVGRNAPCPCGKKYKRCCLGRPQGSAHSHAPGPARPEAPAARIAHEMLGDVRELHVAFRRHTSGELGAAAVDEYFAVLGLDRTAFASSERWITPFMFVELGMEKVGPRCEALRQAAATRMRAHPGRDLWPLVNGIPLGLRESLGQRGGRGRHRFRPVLQGQAPIAEVDGATAHGNASLPERGDFVVGWIVRRDGLALLMSLGVMAPRARAEFAAREAAGEQLLEPEERWREVLAWLFDPNQEARLASILLAQTQLGPQAWAIMQDALTLLDHLDDGHTTFSMREVAGWDQPEEVTLRELVTVAEPSLVSEIAPQLVTRAWERVRYHISISATDAPRGRWLNGDDYLPEDLIRATLLALGVAPDGTLPLWDEEAMAGQPLATLGLSPSHPVWRTLNPRSPIGAAVRWLEDAPEALSTTVELQQALKFARWEQRWMSTVLATAHLERWVQRPLTLGRYDVVRHALTTVFAPTLRRRGLQELRLPSKVWRRIRSGLVAAARDGDAPPLRDMDAPILADLPPRYEDLLRLPGVGEATASDAANALALHVLSWRDQLSAHSPRASPTREPEKTRKRLRAGLDDLAQLFSEQ